MWYDLYIEVELNSGLRICSTLMPDPDPACHFNADPDPHQNDGNLRSLLYILYTVQAVEPIFSLHCERQRPSAS
jgi:hypothetical protein